MPTGMITHLRPNRDDGRGFGTITPDGGGAEVAFDNGSTERPMQTLARLLRGLFRPGSRPERPFDRLSLGQRVYFQLGEHPLQPQHAYAECVRPYAAQIRR